MNANLCDRCGNDPLSLYPMSFVNPNMYMNMFQCGISDMNRIRETAQK